MGITQGSAHHEVLVVGGGTAGSITVATILKRRAQIIAIIEPSQKHYHPAFALVGAGIYPLARTQRADESLIPVGSLGLKTPPREPTLRICT